MSHKETLAKVLLGPVLLAQGIYTRRMTPRLPEAEGERQGEAGSGDVLRLLIVGDSAAAGVGAATQGCLLYTSPSPRDGLLSRMPSSA